MKKVLIITVICITMVAALVGCNGYKNVAPDYEGAEQFESALEEGVDTEGKIVTFTVTDIRPNSYFGYNLFAGKHLNFVSDANPKVQVGDTLTVRVKEVRNVIGSWIITYEMIAR